MSVCSIETHLRPRAQAGVQLAAGRRRPHRRAARRAPSSTCGEAAGRGADVEADAAVRIECEMIERGRELHPAARDPRVRGLGPQHRVGGDFVRGLADGDAVGRHQAGGDGGLRPGAAFEQAAFDEQAVDRRRVRMAGTTNGRRGLVPVGAAAAALQAADGNATDCKRTGHGPKIFDAAPRRMSSARCSKRKKGTLKSGRSGKTVTSRKQAIAIGLFGGTRQGQEGAAQEEE